MTAAVEFLYSWALAVWSVFTASALWLLAGFFFAGLLHVFVPTKLVERHLQHDGFLSVLKASLFGIPLPLCSCSVIPVATALRRAGASKGATASFLVSTPEIGVDSFALSYGLLGAPIACARAIAAFVSALLVGTSINVFAHSDTASAVAASKNCCAVTVEPRGHWFNRALQYGFGAMLDDLAKLLCVGFFAAGLIAVLVPDTLFSSLDLPYFVLLAAVFVISLPLYVCATSSTPLAAVFLMKGVPAGAVLVFLLAGPATNIATIFMVWKELGVRATACYLIGIVIVATCFAMILDFGIFSFGEFGHGFVSHGGHDHLTAYSITDHIAAVVLLLLLIRSSIASMRRD